MSWFDESLARRQRAQRALKTNKENYDFNPADPALQQQQEVEALHPLMERLLSEYGERVFGRSLLQKRFMVRLERPGKSNEKSWNWHWHLDSLVKGLSSIEVHPIFAADGMIQGFLLMSGHKRVEITSTDEEAIKEGLVTLYLK